MAKRETCCSFCGDDDPNLEVMSNELVACQKCFEEMEDDSFYDLDLYENDCLLRKW